ncbi:GGDEF domain-containing protein [Nakamurella panacisegetis]|nr:GGDEF domain-containing protein [Nakamurella panacisegetis]
MASVTLGLSAASNLAINLAMREGGRWGPFVTALGVALGLMGLVGLVLVRTGVVVSATALDIAAALALAGTTIGFLMHALPSPLTWGSLTAYTALALVGAAATIRNAVVFVAFQVFGMTAWAAAGLVFGVPGGLFINLIPVIPLGAAIAVGFFLAQRHERTVQRDLMDQLRLAAEFDLLTGLLNRSGFETRAARLWASDRARRGVWCAFVDIDHFKSVNDLFGHERGDQALREIAVALRGLAGPEDLLVRWGGDEFVMVGCWPAPSEASLTRRLNNRTTSAEAGVVPRVTVGVAERPFGLALTPDELLDAADRRMYELRAGREDRSVPVAPAP